jgi:hypothetical protein
MKPYGFHCQWWSCLAESTQFVELIVQGKPTLYLKVCDEHTTNAIEYLDRIKPTVKRQGGWVVVSPLLLF